MKKVIENFIPQGGKHCITNSLKQIFSYYNYPMSEEMIFGIASGLSFLYINQAHSPMVSGRTKVFEFEKKLAERLNITIKCKTSKNYSKILDISKHMIDTDNPVLIYADMSCLKYLGMNPDSHFGGHAVVLFGYDESAKKFWLSDRDNHDCPIRVPKGQISQDYHLVDYYEIEKARSSSYRPFPANNKFLTFDFKGYRGVDNSVIQSAIKETCETMLNPPAQLLGLNGILKFSKEIKKWNNFNMQKLRIAGATNYFQISKDGGTGGGIFRKMYGEFLIEANMILNDDRVLKIGNEFIELSFLWDTLANDLWQLSLNGEIELLDKMSISIIKIYNLEKNLYSSLLNIV